MKLRIPPPVLTFFCGCLMWTLAYFSQVGQVNIPGRRVIYYLLGFLAIGISVLAISGFKQAQTTIDPVRPSKASTLVTEGIYKWSRNPMYLSLLLFLSAWAVYLGNVMNAGMLVLFFLYLTEFQIKPEENALREKFGQAFIAYSSRVRRWL